MYALFPTSSKSVVACDSVVFVSSKISDDLMESVLTTQQAPEYEVNGQCHYVNVVQWEFFDSSYFSFLFAAVGELCFSCENNHLGLRCMG